MSPKTKSKKQIKKNMRATRLLGKAGGKVGKPIKKPTKPLAGKPTKALIVVHGAGKFAKSDVEAYAAKIKTLYGKPLDTFVAYYADWDETCSGVNILAQSDEQINFKSAFRSELQKRYDGLAPSARPVVVNVVPNEDAVGGIELLGILTKEITSYLFNSSVAQCIQQRLIQVLEQASAYKEIIVVSHSMGTMVASDVLKQFADKYPVSVLITMGGPLGKLRNTGIRSDDLGKITEQNVQNWYNVFDTTDIIADAISPSFPKPGYRIHDIFVEVANTMPEAHDYFNNPETLRLIAETVNTL